ncbi:MBL fold metallo-hydrolase [bacterium]|nr:MBL fold metallo-hydrolase [bacterium]
MTGLIKATILMDNNAYSGLLAEHGFSALIEVAGRRILFDTGQGPAFVRNADILGLDLSTVETLVLSHGHYDHTGGLPQLIERAPAVHIYAHPGITTDRYSVQAGTAREIGMPEAARTVLQNHQDRTHWVDLPLIVANGIGLICPILRFTDYEDTGGPFFLDAEGMRPDPIMDDLAIWLSTDRGLVVVVGCCHAGLINTLRCALKSSGAARLHAVLGGFHLVQASERRLEATMAALEELGPDLIVPCHCTGATAVERLERTFGARVRSGYAGAVYTFNE